MRKTKKLLWVVSVCLFVLVWSTFSYAQNLDYRGGSDALLEEIRAEIRDNGYNFEVDHNWVFDMTQEHKRAFFSRRRAGKPADIYTKQENYGPLMEKLGKTALPSAFDWRNHEGRSYIGPVRNQKSCGACYAFGASAAAEGAYNKTNNLFDGNCADFSEAYIAWCLGALPDYSPHFFGCNGADYEYMELEALTKEGIADESDFPYTTTDPGTCPYSGPTTVFSSWHRVPCGDIDAIKTAIMEYGVVDVAILNTPAFSAYSGGIYEDANTTCPSCEYTTTDHAVALVGWDDNGDPNNNGYWILRNSWGDTNWGENGYMRIKYQSAAVSCAVTYLIATSAYDGTYCGDGTIGAIFYYAAKAMISGSTITGEWCDNNGDSGTLSGTLDTTNGNFTSHGGETTCTGNINASSGTFSAYCTNPQGTGTISGDKDENCTISCNNPSSSSGGGGACFLQSSD